MMTAMDFLIETVLLLPVICIQTLSCHKTAGLKEKWKGLRLAAAVSVCTVLASVTQLFAINYESLSFLGAALNIIFILYPPLIMNGRFKEQIFTGIVNCISFYIAVVLGGALFPQSAEFEGASNTLGYGSYLSAAVFAISIVIVYAVLVFITTHFNTKGKQYLPRKYFTGINICFSVGLVVLILTINITFSFNDTTHLREYFLLISIAFFVIFFLLYFNFYFICRYFTKVNEINEIAVQNSVMERYLFRRQAADERIRVLSHDLKHSLTQWRELAEEKGDKKSLRNISEYEGQLSSALLINTENENANAIINQKHWEAARQNIEFKTEGAFHADLIIENLDLCSLLGNLLDNAIEAAVKTQLPDLRRIKLFIKRRGNLLIIITENGYADEPVKANGNFLTAKEDKRLHALGTRSIRYTAGKYNGAVDYVYENNWFKATVMLCGYKNVL